MAEAPTPDTCRAMRVDTLLLALGANLAGPWGAPNETLRRARRKLSCSGLRVLASSHIYDTAPLGPGRQAPYLNAVLLLRAHIAPAALLRLIKHIERLAGRRLGTRWGPRCLDIDILDYGGRRLGWPQRGRQRGRLILPHPEMHARPFVLVPLLEVDPHWHHPTLAVAGHTLLTRLGRQSRRGIRRSLDFAASSCDKVRNERAPRKQVSEGDGARTVPSS
jgi:2-amino-4-hydroxy-6-hydroxymethyldihydropteridine diphosphokinase